MDRSLVNDVSAGSKKHPRTTDVVLGYGTAGFRRKAVDLDHVLYRVGLLAALRSKAKNGATIGAMITASHNPEEDNGVKVVDPMGEMLEARWEQHAARLANVTDSDVGTCLEAIVTAEEIDVRQSANVVFARDTRPSSKQLSVALEDGVVAFGGNLRNYGLLTTPQLHYMVRCINSQHAYGKPELDGYYTKITEAFHNLVNQAPVKDNYTPSLCVDAANGIGAVALNQLRPYLRGSLDISVCNNGTSGRLNYMCGADYVKMQQKAPDGVELVGGVRYASFDGDADRIVFYYKPGESASSFQLLDGDKIATLFAGYLKDLLGQCDLGLDLGIVQTAYANGSSARYITDTLRVPLACVPTGVKHLHHRAQQMDIGVYFEANGHGTVLFSDKATAAIRKGASDANLNDAQKSAYTALSAVLDVVNETVGDAVSDMLLVEVILRHRGWNAADWNKTYTDLPNRQLKVSVEDRTLIQTTDAERKTTSPEGLQQAIDGVVANYHNGRSFVRPSGTEDVVRVYAEATTQEEADRLAHDVSLKVHALCRGVGDPPSGPAL